MGLEELKVRVHALVDSATSEESLRKAEQDLQEGAIPFVDPRYEAGILRGIQQIKDGQGIPLEVFRAERLAWRKARGLE